MDDEKAIAVIRRLILDREYLIAAAKRKRKWRDSEKAVTIANYREQMYALDRALGALQYRIDNMPQVASVKS